MQLQAFCDAVTGGVQAARLLLKHNANVPSSRLDDCVDSQETRRDRDANGTTIVGFGCVQPIRCRGLSTEYRGISLPRAHRDRVELPLICAICSSEVARWHYGRNGFHGSDIFGGRGSVRIVARSRNIDA
jgi:hypothetical protein